MAYSDYSPEFSAHINYKPRYLKPEPEKTQLDEDQEVISMVKHNPSRKVDADALPPIVVEDNGTMHFADPKPDLWTTFLSLSSVTGIAISLGIGLYSMIHAAVTGGPSAFDVVGMILGALAGLVVLCLWRESKTK